MRGGNENTKVGNVLLDSKLRFGLIEISIKGELYDQNFIKATLYIIKSLSVSYMHISEKHYNSTKLI